MIKDQTYSAEWILEVKRKLGRRTDAKLVEKVVYALAFLEQLQVNGLEFIFKGGTALLLATEVPKRFSIDIDIITGQSEAEIVAVIERVQASGIFLRWEDDNARKHTPDAPVGHFKMFYNSLIDGREEPILLDVLYTPNPYPELMEIPIRHPWIDTEGAITTVAMPTFDAILGDKLTAFAPRTTGILYSKDRPVEIIKQLYDIAFLFDNIDTLEVVKASYGKVVAEEIGFRNLEISADDVLQDTREACYVLSIREEKDKDFQQLFTGIRNFTNFTIQPFRIDEAIVAAAKVAYLVGLLKSDIEAVIERYIDPAQIKDWIIEDQQYNKLNKLKKNNPEAFYYWFKTLN